MAQKIKVRTDGRILVTFTFEGKRYFSYGRTRKEAQEAAEQRKRELEKGRYKRAAELTFSEYYERWKDARRLSVKGATLRKQQFQYEAAATVLIDKSGQSFGNVPLPEIEVNHIRILQKVLLQGPGGKQRAPDTVNGIVALISHILRDAVNERAIEWNPCTGIKNLKRTAKPARETIHRALTLKETELFFNAAVESWYYDLYRFLIQTGCRCGEAGALRTSDIKANEIQIRRTITKNEHGVYVVGDSPKTSYGTRNIPMTDGIREVIAHQKKLNANFFGDKVISLSSPIFMTSWGNLLAVANVDRDIARICRAAGIQKFTAHAFRDTFATRAVEANMKPKTLQEILGHADIGVTMNLYAHVMEETKVQEMNAVVALSV
ncbi:MAG: tyrosine-type recombinase/integrase [Stomatobaculum sp.]